MSDTPGFFSRLQAFIRPTRRGGSAAVADDAVPPPSPTSSGELVPVQVKRSIFRPWARRRDEAIGNLQRGFHALTDLMSTIRENLEGQARRQEEMIAYLSSLPRVLESLPESQRAHGEALRAIGEQLQHQVAQQSRLAEILERVTDSSVDQRQALELLQGHVQALGEHNEAIGQSLRQVGSSMESVGKHSDASAQVLRQMHETLGARDGQIEQALRRQNTRLTIMLAAAMVLSLAAVGSAVLVGVMAVNRLPAATAPTAR